jgi:hypothetical protein
MLERHAGQAASNVRDYFIAAEVPLLTPLAEPSGLPGAWLRTSGAKTGTRFGRSPRGPQSPKSIRVTFQADVI